MIKDRYGNVRASEESVLGMGKEYLEELINEKKMTAQGGRVEDTH